MFKWLKAWLEAWAERCQQREIQRLHEEGCRLKEEIIEVNGGGPIPLSPEEQGLLAEEAKGIDPEVLKEISLFDLPGSRRHPPTDTSTESP